MASNSLPPDGELRIGPVMLPAGRQIHAGYGSGGPVAWATTEPVPDAGRVWAALSAAHPDTGLVPFLLSGLDFSSAALPLPTCSTTVGSPPLKGSVRCEVCGDRFAA